MAVLSPEDAKDLFESLKPMFQEMITAAAPPTTPPETTPPAAPANADLNAPMTREVMMEAMQKVMGDMTTTNEKNTNDKLFQQSLDTLISSTPRLKTYLDSEDELGVKRLDRLNAITDYDKKLESLKLFNQRALEAVTAPSGQDGTLSPEEEKQVTDQNKRYGDIFDKIGKEGELPMDEFFTELLDNEMLEKALDEVMPV